MKPTLEDMLPRTLPRAWKEDVPPPSIRWMPCRAWSFGKLKILLTLEDMNESGLWMHASVSRPKMNRLPSLPSWEDLGYVKQVIFEDRAVIQVLPPRAHYVNLVEALHIWERLDQPTIPEAVWRTH